MTKIDIAKECVELYKNALEEKTLNKTDLAKILCNRKEFTSVEDARWHVRKALGKTGKQKIIDQVQLKSEPFKVPKILLFDLETLPIVSYHWGVWDQNIPHIMRLKDWCLVTWSAKWLFDPEMISYQLTPKEAKARDDKRIVRDLWDLFEEADVLIAHNLKGFDCKRANTRFILNGLQPPSPYSMIDTLIEARKHFAFDWNKLDYLGDILVNKKKIKTDFDLWRGCDEGNQADLDQMAKYNNVDVLLLEEVYLILRPWIKSHPNLAVHDPDKERCVYCLSDELRSLNSFYTTPAGRFQSMRCVACGGINRSRYSDLNKAKKKNLLTSVAR